MATSAMEGKRRVYELAKATLPDCQVTFGTVKSPQKSWCLIGSVTYLDSTWAAIGARHRKESYEVAVVVNCTATGMDGQTLETKVLGLVDALDTALRSDPTLGGLAQSGCAIVPKKFSSQPTNDGFEAQWEGVVRFMDVRI